MCLQTVRFCIFMGGGKKMPKPKPEPKTHSQDDKKHLVTSGTMKRIPSRSIRQPTAQVKRYSDLTSHLLDMQARIELAEKTLCLTRDHLAMTITQTDSATPQDWEQHLREVRFVGVRLADACMVLLKEKKALTPQEILIGLNRGMFRFRTNSPLAKKHTPRYC